MRRVNRKHLDVFVTHTLTQSRTLSWCCDNCSLTWAWQWPVWAFLSDRKHLHDHKSGKPACHGSEKKIKTKSTMISDDTQVRVQKEKWHTWLSALHHLWAGRTWRRSSWPIRRAPRRSSSPPPRCSFPAPYPGGTSITFASLCQNDLMHPTIFHAHQINYNVVINKHSELEKWHSISVRKFVSNFVSGLKTPRNV